MEDINKRLEKNPLLMMIPGLFQKEMTKEDTRFFTNARHLRNFVAQAIKDRQQKFAEGQDPESAADMIGILLQDDQYKDKHSDIIDDVIVLFIAGSKTIQGTTTSFITHLTEFTEWRDKLRNEVDATFEPIKDNIQEKLTTDIVENFEVLKKIYFEVLRYYTPFPMGSPANFSKDLTIGDVKFLTHDAFTINMQQIHMNEKEWPEPHTF